MVRLVAAPFRAHIATGFEAPMAGELRAITVCQEAGDVLKARHPVLAHEGAGRGIGNALITQDGREPIVEAGGVMLLDRATKTIAEHHGLHAGEVVSRDRDM